MTWATAGVRQKASTEAMKTGDMIRRGDLDGHPPGMGARPCSFTPTAILLPESRLLLLLLRLPQAHRL